MRLQIIVCFLILYGFSCLHAQSCDCLNTGDTAITTGTSVEEENFSTYGLDFGGGVTAVGYCYDFDKTGPGVSGVNYTVIDYIPATNIDEGSVVANYNELLSCFECSSITDVQKCMWSQTNPTDWGASNPNCSGINNVCDFVILMPDANTSNWQPLLVPCDSIFSTINCCTEPCDVTASAISSDQSVCTNEIPTALTSTSLPTGTGNFTHQWQQSTTDCNSGFTNIIDATTTTYSPSGLTQTTHYQLITTSDLGCNDTSNCITITVNPFPEPFTAISTECASDGESYTLNFASNGIVTASEGTVSGNQVLNIPDSAAVVLTSTLNDCAISIMLPATVCPNYALNLTKVVNNELAELGEQVVFTITVFNSGTGDVTGVEVTEILSPGLTYLNDDSGGIYDKTTGLWNIGSIAIGDSAIIEITTLITESGLIINKAEITKVNEIDLEDISISYTNFSSNACISIPIEVCNSDPISIGLEAESGYTNYQWYKNNLPISGGNVQLYTVTEPGSYTYTVDGIGPNDCIGELCCPIIIEAVSCCPPIECLPVTITKINE